MKNLPATILAIITTVISVGAGDLFKCFPSKGIFIFSGICIFLFSYSAFRLLGSK